MTSNITVIKLKKKKNRRSNGENHIVVVLDPKKVKTKDVSKGENLSEAPKDEIFDYFWVIFRKDHQC